MRATVLIETVSAAFEMDEILYELGPHATGLNAGRWDYLFSVIKKLGHRPEFVLPDRNAVGMTAPFMRAYAELLVKTCHRRGAHAIGGMAAFIPSRRDPEVNGVALEKVREDKEREASRATTGPGWRIPISCRSRERSFDRVLGDRPNQLEVLAGGDRRHGLPTSWTSRQLRARSPRMASVTTSGRDPVPRGLAAGLGSGCDLQPDGGRGHLGDLALAGLAVAPSREGHAEQVERLTDEEVAKLDGDFADARQLFEQVATGEEFVEFLTLPAYDRLTELRSQ